MENEGIMALPQGASMSGEPAQEQQTVTSAQSYDAAQTALGMTSPDDLAMLKESLRQNMAEVDMTPGELTAFIDVLEYMSQRPAEYKEIRQKLIEDDLVDPEDMPEEYDVEFIGTMLAVLNEVQMSQAQGAQAPMMDMPPVEGADAMQGMGGMQPMAMAKGGLADVASYLAAQGRNGDSMLAHITPEEAQLLKDRGGSGTINPVTGLPEFFKKFFKKVWKSVTNVAKKVLKSPIGRILATVALATVLGPTAIGMALGKAGTMAVVSGGLTLAGGGSVKEALISGAMGYIGGGGTIMGANPISAVGGYLPGAAGSALNTGLATGVIGAGVGKLGGMSTQDALKMGLTSGLSAAAMQGLDNTRAEQGVRDAQFRSEMAGPQGGGTAQDLLASQSAPAQAGGGGTAQDLLASRSGLGLNAPAMGSSMDFDPMTGSFKANYGVGPQGAPSTGGVGMDGAGAGISGSGSVGMQPNQAFSGRDFSMATGGSGLGTNYSLTPAPAAPAASSPTGFFDKMVAGGKDLYNEYLSPSRPGLPADAGLLRKYGPLALAGTAVVGAAGGMKGEDGEEDPLFNSSRSGRDYIRDNPNQFSGGLDMSYQRPTTPKSPIVQTNFATQRAPSQPGQIVPMGATMSPAGVAQPYNMAGMYGVPLIYGPDGQPQRLAKGGSPVPTEFPRKNGPINGPGTGTSDDIPAMLSDGEFVFTAKAVRNAGNGSRRKGAARMYKLMKMLEGGPVKGK
jgi:hypothetical protein